MQYPDVVDVLDAYYVMKGGKSKKGRPARASADFPPDPPFASEQEKHAFHAAMAKEAMAVKRESKSISTQPLEVQRTFAMRNRSVEDVFDEIKSKK